MLDQTYYKKTDEIIDTTPESCITDSDHAGYSG